MSSYAQNREDDAIFKHNQKLDEKNKKSKEKSLKKAEKGSGAGVKHTFARRNRQFKDWPKGV